MPSAGHHIKCIEWTSSSIHPFPLCIRLPVLCRHSSQALRHIRPLQRARLQKKCFDVQIRDWPSINNSSLDCAIWHVALLNKSTRKHRVSKIRSCSRYTTYLSIQRTWARFHQDLMRYWAAVQSSAWTQKMPSYSQSCKCHLLPDLRSWCGRQTFQQIEQYCLMSNHQQDLCKWALTMQTVCLCSSMLPAWERQSAPGVLERHIQQASMSLPAPIWPSMRKSMVVRACRRVTSEPHNNRQIAGPQSR